LQQLEQIDAQVAKLEGMRAYVLEKLGVFGEANCAPIEIEWK
jgi:hypothetical protein